MSDRRHLEPGDLQRLASVGWDQRQRWLSHAAACESCRRRLLVGDPTRVFSLIATRPLPRAALDRLSTRVNQAIDSERAPLRPHESRFTWVSLAASLLLAAALATLMPSTSVDRSRPVELERLAAAPTSASAPIEPSVPVSGIRVLSSPGDAQVLDLTVDEMQVVMIFDKELDI